MLDRFRVPRKEDGIEVEFLLIEMTAVLIISVYSGPQKFILTGSIDKFKGRYYFSRK